MAATKPEVLISKLTDQLGTPLQRQNLCFWGLPLHWRILQCRYTETEVKNQSAILDTAGVNSFVAFSLMHPEWKNHIGSTRRDKRRFFLLEVGESLVDEHMQRRAQNRMIVGRPQVVNALALMGILTAPSELETQEKCNKKRGRCANCRRTKEQKVVNRCQICEKFICGVHAKKTANFTCLSCSNQSNEG
jgi:hypothetical protein